ncbi:hypothetical protein P0L94_06295 [Microbacter sp. GSS18]|nr:hypothetical protein P0L94_06295 [Microbacter sp. GSS18]
MPETPDRPITASRTWLRVLEHVALVLVAIGGPLAMALGSAPYLSYDEAAHVDHALRIWQGELPVRGDPLVLGNEVGFSAPIQWTWMHPPYFYIVLAPIVGPLVDAGMVVEADFAARLSMLPLSVAMVYTVRAIGRRMFPSVPAVGLASAVVVALATHFVGIGGAVYNDKPAVLFAALAFLFLLRFLRVPSWGNGIGIALSAAAAVGSRFGVLPMMLLFLGVPVVAALFKLLPLVRALAVAGVGVAAIAALNGWFYLRNISITGNISGRRGDDWVIENLGRVRRPPLEVALDRGFWSKMLQQYSIDSYADLPFLRDGTWWTLLLFVVPLAAGIALCVVGLVRRPEHRIERILVLGTILAVFAGMGLTVVLYVAGGGGWNSRYLFTITPFAAPLMALALLRPRRAPWLFAIWAAIRTVLVALQLRAAELRADGAAAPQGDAFPVLGWGSIGLLGVGVVLALVVAFAMTRAAERETAVGESPGQAAAGSRPDAADEAAARER